MSLKVINWLLFGVCYLYNMLDCWHTKLLLATGVIEEANPLMDYFIRSYRVDSIFIVKSTLFVFLGVVLHLKHKGCK